MKPGDTFTLLLGISSLAGRALLSAILLQAGIQKIRHHAEIDGVIRNYRILPAALTPFVSWSLPVVELLLAIALLIRDGWPGLAAAFLFALFTLAIVVNLGRGRAYIDCGCFQSSLRQKLSWLLVARNIVLIAICACADTASLNLRLPAAAVACLFGIVCFVLYQSLNALSANRPSLISLSAS